MWTVRLLPSCRSAAPTPRRNASSSNVVPTPVATTSGNFASPSVGILTTSSGLPVAPAAASAARKVPLSASSTGVAPGARSGPLSPCTTPTTTASAVRAAVGATREILGMTAILMSPNRVSDMNELLRSALHDRHVALGAKLADFGGWEMPIEYAASGGGVLREHTAVREAVGVFDVSHLGKATVRGSGARAFVNECLTNDLGRIQPGKAQYTLCCDESGGVVDDLIAYLVSDDEVFLVPNAANTAEVVRRLAAAAPDGVTVEEQHRAFGVLAVQGPRSADVLGALGLPAELDYMAYVDASFEGSAVRVC